MYYFVAIWLDNCALYLQMSWSDILRTRYDIQDITNNFRNMTRPSIDTKVTCNGLKCIHSLKNTGNHYACLDLLMSRTNKDKIFLKKKQDVHKEDYRDRHHRELNF